MPSVLITGFSRFEGCEINPTECIVKALEKDGFHIDDTLDINYSICEVSTNAVSELHSKYKDYDIYIHLGVNVRGEKLQIERYAYNNMTFRVKDESGKQYDKELIQTDQEFDKQCATEFNMVTLHDEFVTKKPDVPVYISDDPGRFLCNYIYYTSLQYTNKALFIHIPPFDDNEMWCESNQIDNIKLILTIILSREIKK